MAIAASGAVSLADFRTEFVGGSSPISMDDLYRGGSNIRAKAANNTATNLAASVPTSGAINFDDFYGTAKGFRKTYTETATNQNASSVFGDDYGVDYPKEIVVNSGVELGATSTSEEALQADAGLVGSLTITNNGTLTGAGGAAGAAGGDAFEANVACTLINNGTIRAGGGGGGNGGTGGSGGTGGQGRVTNTSYGSWQNYGWSNGNGGGALTVPGGTPNQVRNVQFNNSQTNGFTYVRVNSGSTGVAAKSNQVGPMVLSGPYNNITTIEWRNANDNNDDRGHGGGSYQRRLQTTSYTYYNGGSGGSGGAGGAGGVGQGYGQAAGTGASGSAGSSGSAGGTNAGAGGTGGTGGSGGAGGAFGQAASSGNSGATGNSGANGNYTNGSGGSGGSSGSSGGAAGNYIRGLSNVTFTNNGTVQGTTA